MGFFNKLRSDGETFDGQGNERRGLVDVIQYNGTPDELVWKFPYNNLSTGAQLIVNKSQEAIFVKGGTRERQHHGIIVALVVVGHWQVTVFLR